MSESIQVLRKLWTESAPEHRGKFFHFGPSRFEPKPVQRPHPPIIVGGDSDIGMRRAARLGDGWCGLGHSPEAAAPQVSKMRRLLAEQGRDAAPFEMMVNFYSNTLTRDDVRRYEDAGLDHIIVFPWSTPDEAEWQLERFGERLRL